MPGSTEKTLRKKHYAKNTTQNTRKIARQNATQNASKNVLRKKPYEKNTMLETKVYGFTEQIYSTLSFQQRVAFFDVLSLSLAFLGLSSSWRSQQHLHFISH